MMACSGKGSLFKLLSAHCLDLIRMGAIGYQMPDVNFYERFLFLRISLLHSNLQDIFLTAR
ncbi:hypothetical protein BVG16_19795 [Paenibacillus selenitireducens]|uniref:Uncharacterized protein n=1 Tax=Paenibacillus selenitireducens TaxID=1324314 RepID=A0A1T2X6T0_9BACL|nr:hypothetical protein BVG16_19795 [Paenibacillus selenitireducens]